MRVESIRRPQRSPLCHQIGLSNELDEEPSCFLEVWSRKRNGPRSGPSFSSLVEAARIELASGNTTQSGLHA